MEAVIPTEISLPTIRTTTPESKYAGSMVRELDTSDELREAAVVRVASYQRRLENSYNKRVRPRVFHPGDLVLRKVFENTADPTVGKFQPNWEGPYVVTRPGGSGSYVIDKTDGTHVPRMWNAMHLKVLSIKECLYYLLLACLRISILNTGSHYKSRWRSSLTCTAQHRSHLAGQFQSPGGAVH